VIHVILETPWRASLPRWRSALEFFVGDEIDSEGPGALVELLVIARSASNSLSASVFSFGLKATISPVRASLENPGIPSAVIQGDWTVVEQLPPRPIIRLCATIQQQPPMPSPSPNLMRAISHRSRRLIRLLVRPYKTSFLGLVGTLPMQRGVLALGNSKGSGVVYLAWIIGVCGVSSLFACHSPPRQLGCPSWDDNPASSLTTWSTTLSIAAITAALFSSRPGISRPFSRRRVPCFRGHPGLINGKASLEAAKTCRAAGDLTSDVGARHATGL